MAKVFGITGWKNSGKTTLVARLVTELSARGLTVSTIKNASHSYTMDREGTDTHAHAKAGAHEVAITAGHRWAILHEGQTPTGKQSLQSMLERLSPCDLVLVEGFKTSGIPKIQAMRREAKEQTPIWKTNDSVIAIAADHERETDGLATFHLDEITAMADFIMENADETTSSEANV